MEKRTLPKRDAIIIVVLVHIGIVLLWVSMGGCGDSSTREVTQAPAEPVKVEDVNTAYETVEPAVTVTDEGPSAVLGTSHTAGTTRPGNEVRYVVEAGDSLWKISRRFGVTVEAIADRNDISDPAMIRAGRELWIPNPTKGVDETSTGPTTTVGTGPTTTVGTEPTTTVGTEPPVTEPITGGTTPGEVTPGETTPGETVTPVEPVDIGTIETIEYVVQPGDTIWKLARTYNTTSKIIMDLNGITDPKKMRAGDTIKIPKPAGQ
jgi:LysM repeat protein